MKNISRTMLVHKLDAEKNNDLRAFFKYFELNTWSRIGFARSRTGLKVWETTITQNLLFELNSFAEGHKFGIKMFEAISEKTNGNDIELCVQTHKGFIKLPIQAKIIYKNEKYQQLDHEVRGEDQINLLMEYASNIEGYPFYLLYNFAQKETTYNAVSKKATFDIEYYGCSIVSAHYLKKNYYQKRWDASMKLRWKLPTFGDLHPKPSVPLHFLTNFFLTEDKGGKTQNRGRTLSYQRYLEELGVSNAKQLQLRTYTLNDLLTDQNWESMQKYKDTIVPIKENYISQLPTFSPKFRVILSRKNMDF